MASSQHALENLENLVGSVVLSHYRLEELVQVDNAIATYRASHQQEAFSCSLCLSLEVEQHQEAMLLAAFDRIAKHAVGIRLLASPQAAGVVVVEGVRYLSLVHRGTPTPNAEQRIESGQKASLDTVLGILEPISEALGALHDQGIVHGAVQPGVIRLDPTGSSLSAFGLSELVAILGGANAARDILPFRNRTPEQVGLVPSKPSARSDTYALAIVALELLAGRPFTEEKDPSELARLIDHPIERPSPKSLGIDLPQAAEKVFAKALATIPMQRQADPRAFLKQLSESRYIPDPAIKPTAHPSTEQAIQTPLWNPPEKASPVAENKPKVLQSPKDQPPTPFHTPTTRRKRNTLVYVFIGLGSLLLLFGAAFAFFFALQATPSTTGAPPLVATMADAGPLAQLDASTAPATDSQANPPTAPPTPFQATWLSAENTSYPQDANALIPIDSTSAILGSRDALVTIQAFLNVQCPASGQALVELEKLMKEYRSDLRVVVRYGPISDYRGSSLAAEVAASVYALDGPNTFWNVLKGIMQDPVDQPLDSLLQFAEAAGANEKSLRKAMDDHVHQAAVQRDTQLAGQLMVRSTPTFFINGMRVNGIQSRSVFHDTIRKERRAARSSLSSGTPREELYSARVKFHVTDATVE